MRVQDVCLGIGNRLADGKRCQRLSRSGKRHLVEQRSDGSFRQPIGVVAGSLLSHHFAPGVHMGYRDFLAAHYHALDTGRWLATRARKLGDPLVPVRGGKVEDCQLLREDEAGEVRRGGSNRLRPDHNRRPLYPCRQKLFQRHIETNRCKMEHPVGGMQLVTSANCQTVIE